MRLGNSASVEELQAVSRYDGLRQSLFAKLGVGQLDKPLSYWALPTDRCLPLALLDRSLRDILNTPFMDLTATRGIGRKKVVSLVRLLARAEDDISSAATAENVEDSAGSGDLSNDAAVEQIGDVEKAFNPGAVSEAAWAEWQASVVRHGLSDETLGRLAPSLRDMTRVIWNTPLGVYTSATLAEIRAMKTHGEKRVRAIIEVFHAAYTITADMGKCDHLVTRIVPRLIDRVERWTGRMLQRPGLPDRQEIFAEFAEPLFEQIRLDATQQVAALAASRLGIGCEPTSVRQAARDMKLTRARVYQLLSEINDIMAVRWLMGCHQVHELREKFSSEASPESDLSQFHAAVELFYPGGRRGASGPLECAFEPAEEDGELVGASYST